MSAAPKSPQSLDLERLRPILDTALDAVVIMSADGTVADWNRVAESTFGWPREKALGRSMGELIVPAQHRAAHEAGLQRFLATGEGPVLGRLIEITALHRLGHEIPIELSITVAGDSDVVFVGFLRDISERRRSEELLARQAREAAMLFRIAQLAAQADSIQAVLPHTLEAICDVTGWPLGHALLVEQGEPDELVPTEIWYDAGHPGAQSLKDATRGLRFPPGIGLPGLILKTGEPAWIGDTDRETVFIRKGLGFASAFGFPIKTAGNVMAVLEFFTDEKTAPNPDLLLTVRTLGEQVGRVIERNLAVAELRALNQSLETRIGEAVAEREQALETLRQSQKMEAVGQLTGGIAHDFNNLLTVITGNIDAARRRLGDKDENSVGRALMNAMVGAERAATLTQRLLAFSRRQPLNPKPLDPNKLVAGMSDLLHRTLGETVEIETVLSAGLWRVEVDPHQLENAILNLAVNGRDAMAEGGKLTIETSNTHLDRAYVSQNAEIAPGQYVAIYVSDTGTGMDDETVARAFEPFFTTKDVDKGTGLGLSMVYGFVKQSGGHLKIYSEPGGGTTVKIYLPRLVSETSDVEEERIDATIPEGTRGETILVCEDDDDVRAYSVEVLRELGYRVLEAHDGPSALRLLERQEGGVDLLFTDVVLPTGMTGAVLAQEARAIQPDLKVLFTTGYARNAIVHHGRLDPGVELITKPFAYADLAARIRDILDGTG